MILVSTLNSLYTEVGQSKMTSEKLVSPYSIDSAEYLYTACQWSGID